MIGHVFKYALPMYGEIMELELPKDCAICDVKHQDNGIYLWAMIDTHAAFEKRKFIIYGTGWQINDIEKLHFLKTIHAFDGLVWHVFEVINEANAQ